MKNIIITTFYFGQKPWYLKYFINSCIKNEDIDFIFFTDLDIEKINYENFKIIKISFQEFCQIISKFFEFEVIIDNPTKLCDFRPSFGEIFQNLLGKYNFWGYCDIDIVFGRIGQFLTLEILNEYDVIFCKHEYPSGFFTIFKNNNIVNGLYRSSNDYIKIFQSNDLKLFDECGVHYDAVCNGVNILDIEYDIDSMHHILERNKEKINVLYEFFSLESSTGKLKYKNGVLIYNDQFEILLYHFTTFKNNYFFNEDKESKIQFSNENFYIGKFEICKLNYFSIFINKINSSIKPYLTRKFLLLDLLISKLFFFKRNREKLKIGDYVYMKRKLTIQFEKNVYYMLYPNGSKNRIFFLTFFSNIFYVKNENQFCLMSDSVNNIYSGFNQIFENGTIMKYKNYL